MLKKFILSLLIISTTVLNVTGQEQIRKCGLYEANEALMLAHPELVEELKLAKKNSEIEMAQFNFGNKMTPDTVIIPVVFHIVHNNGPANVSNQTIFDAIEQMNLDYMASDDDIANVVSDFEDIIGIPQIIFKLAQYDPDGNCTNGITRTVSTLTNTGGDDLKDSDEGGIDGWDRASYLNIWVSRIASETGDPNVIVNGYSRYPYSVSSSNQAWRDGIVARSDAIGLGERTLTHEAAHWLNIMHPWGDSNNPGESENCDEDDNVDDTPNTIGYFGGCNTAASSCGSLDNVQNHMEYSDCSLMFTEGQADRMISALNSSTAQRSSLWTDTNLDDTGVSLDPILCLADFEADELRICQEESISFTNLSYNGDTEWLWEFEGGTPATSTEENPEVTYNEAGVFEVTLTIGNGTDEVSVTKESYVNVLSDEGIATPFTEGFEDVDELPNENWIITSTNNSEDHRYWEITSTASSEGSYSAILKNYYQDTNEKDELESNPIDLSSLNDVHISFDFAYAKKHSDDDDVLRFKVTRTCGNTWITRETLRATDNTLVTASNHLTFFTPENDEWESAYVDNISSQYLIENFRMKFEFISGDGNNVFIDNINLFDPSTVGINEVNKAALNYEVFPNPVNDELNIKFNLLHNTNVKGEVFDISGRKIATLFDESFPIGTNTLNFNTNNWNAGMYLVRISLEGENFIEKVLKK